MLLNNPWEKIDRDSLDAFDLRYQMELWGKPATVNSGQMLCRKSEAALALIDYVISKEETEMDRLDQDWVEEAIQNSSAKATVLPSNYFVGACWHKEIDTPVVELSTYHAHCVENKEQVMRILNIAVLSAIASSDESVLLRDIDFDAYDMHHAGPKVIHSLDRNMSFGSNSSNSSSSSSSSCWD